MQVEVLVLRLLNSQGCQNWYLTEQRRYLKILKRSTKNSSLIFSKENKERAEDNTKTALTILSILKDIDINRVSPMHAFDLLNDLVTRAKEENHED